MIAVSGAPKKEFHDKRVSPELEKIMNEKTTFLSKGNSNTINVADGTERYLAGVVVPIISEGDPIGSVVMMSSEGDTQMGEVEEKLAQSAAGFLGRQME